MMTSKWLLNSKWFTRLVLAVFFTGTAVPLAWLAWQLASAYREAEKINAATRTHGLDVQHASIERCRKAGGFAVMGFAAVVCVEPGSVKWSEEIQW